MLSEILVFLIGVIIGSLIGMSLMCLCMTNKREEDQ